MDNDVTPEPFASPDPFAAPAETVVMNENRASQPPRPSNPGTWQAPAVIGLFLVVAMIAAAVGIGLGSGSDEVVSAGAPANGACRTYDGKEALAAHNDSPVVPCEDQHSAQTFAVAETLPAPTADGGWSNRQVAVAAQTPCGTEAAATSVGITPQEFFGTRLTVAFFVPTTEQAKAGARWVRCDIVLTDSGDTATVAGEFAELVKIQGAFASCADLTGLSTSAGQRVTRCSDDPSLYATVGTVPLRDTGRGLNTEAIRNACRGNVQAQTDATSPVFQVTLPNLSQAGTAEVYARCWLRADQWKVDQAAWPDEISLAPSSTTSV